MGIFLLSTAAYGQANNNNGNPNNQNQGATVNNNNNGGGGDGNNGASTTVSEAAASSARSAALVASQGTCLGSAGVGAQGLSFGASIASTKKDLDCNRRRYAAILISLGEEAAAIRLMCNNTEVRESLLDLCPILGHVVNKNTIQEEETLSD